MAESNEQRGDGRQLFCRVITPEEVIYDGEANLVVARIADGDLGVLVDHSPLVSTVEVGEVRIREGDEQHVYATSDGFFKVSENLVQVLVEEAVSVGDIDVQAAENRVERAEQELSEVSEEAEDRDRVISEIERRQRMGENLVRAARKYSES
ncbi:ATP synthase epsilon chain [uncultured Rubrobacteraceae bacterium]|uniref:ATP synthase epsilon chain n=1 Tax=uncultured Rubrobacteraceae bacterium TaxID=349277 RepID=A0A6J4PS33_9ACTN|nr:ATP synthase epsilon chain [uncultured Rubrobacteraceae bacterium]